MNLLERVIQEARGGVTHVVYDRLMAGTHMRRLMKLGVLPVVPMPGSPPKHQHLKLDKELQRDRLQDRGHQSQGKKVGRGKPVAPKERLILRPMEPVSHDTPLGACWHDLWALDGAVISVAPGVAPSLDAHSRSVRRTQLGSRRRRRAPHGPSHGSCRRFVLCGDRLRRRPKGQERRRSATPWLTGFVRYPRSPSSARRSRVCVATWNRRSRG